MTLDTTIPLWGVISLLFTPIGGLIWMVVNLHFKAKSLEGSLKEAQDDIKQLESALDSEMKKIHSSINKMNESLQQLNTYVKLMLDGKINTDGQIKRTI